MPKKRQTLTYSSNGIERNISSSGVILNEFKNRYTFLESGELSSSGHKWPPNSRNATLDIGGDFLVTKSRCEPGPVFVDASTNRVGYPRRTYQGDMFARATGYSASEAPTPSNTAQLNALGSTGIARALPTNPLSGMGQFLGELRDFPRLFGVDTWKPRAADFRNQWRKFLRSGPTRGAADAYLNAMFGWAPFLNDIFDFVNVTRNANAHIAQYERNSGRPVRRRVTIFDDTTTEVSLVSAAAYAQPSLATPLYDSTGRLTRTLESHRKVWFSGSFTYYLPSVEGPLGRMRRAEALGSKLYGLRLTPELLWQLTPWSWAVDWVTNSGDVIRNWSAFQNDGLVMHYGYVMEHKQNNITYVLDGCALKGYGRLPSLTQKYVLESKIRRRATPYGFGLDPGTFSSRQWSIIAALGISRVPRGLNF